MKTGKLVVIAIVVVIALGVIGYLYTQGYLQDFEWQTATMFFAALAGPYKMVMKWLKGNPEEDEILGKHDKIKEEEKIHRAETDAKIQEKTQKIEELDKELEVVNKKIELVQAQKADVTTEVDQMSEDELKNEAQSLFGDE